jgi:hypothetical protein
VVEVEVDLHHNATGKDLSGLLHRARQARAIARELTRRRAWRPTPNRRTSGTTKSADAGSPQPPPPQLPPPHSSPDRPRPADGSR